MSSISITGFELIIAKFKKQYFGHKKPTFRWDFYSLLFCGIAATTRSGHTIP